jgi:hypothetical protein
MPLERVAKQGRALGGSLGGMLAQPAFPRRARAILFGLPVLRHDVLWGERHDLRLSRADDHRGEGRVRVEGLPMGALTGETLEARHRCGRQGGGTIQSKATNRWAARTRQWGNLWCGARPAKTSSTTASRWLGARGASSVRP